MELKDTIELMQSADYKERFIAEYYQVKIRCIKLTRMLVDYKRGALNFVPTTPIKMLKKQLKHMKIYMRCLSERAKIEGIDLYATYIPPTLND